MRFAYANNTHAVSYCIESFRLNIEGCHIIALMLYIVLSVLLVLLAFLNEVLQG